MLEVARPSLSQNEQLCRLLQVASTTQTHPIISGKMTLIATYPFHRINPLNEPQKTAETLKKGKDERASHLEPEMDPLLSL